MSSDPRGAVPVLTVTGARWESELVAAVEHRPLGVVVVRRCVDLADLLATASSGTARAVLLSADLRRLDRDALARLETARVAVIALAGDDAAERRLRQLGCRHVLPADSPPDRVSAQVRDAVTELARTLAAAPRVSDPAPSYADPRSALPYVTGAGDDDPSANALGTGRLVAVWGPTGAPGRTTVAVTLAPRLQRLAWPPCWPTPTPTAAASPSSSAFSMRRPALLPRRGRRTLARSTIKRSRASPDLSSRNCASSRGSAGPNGGRRSVLRRSTGGPSTAPCRVSGHCGFSMEREGGSPSYRGARRNGARWCEESADASRRRLRRSRRLCSA